MNSFKSDKIIEAISELRLIIKNFKSKNLIIGFVPTMGALHYGHESLIHKARQECDIVLVSIFVNPTQFSPGEDFEKYPRELEKDMELCLKAGVDFVFAPSPNELYPEGLQDLTTVFPPEVYHDKLCGKSRQGHFNGVATVVCKLFNIVQPDRAYFGLKDAQQVLVIKKMVSDLNFPVEVVPCPLIRESDGLAYSSRNKYLSQDSRGKALCIFKALQKVKTAYESGLTLFSDVVIQAGEEIYPEIQVEYFEAYDFDKFSPVNELKRNTLVAIAVKLDGVRLIDNIIL